METKEMSITEAAKLEPVVATADWPLMETRPMKSIWADPGALKSLENARDSLISAYLGACLNYSGIPVKDFMDGVEKHLLLACLSMTQGHQRNAAVILGLRPTTLFEKMQKHCIRGQQIKLSRWLKLERPRGE